MVTEGNNGYLTSEITEVFTLKVINMNIVYYDGAWKHGEESDERAPAFSLQVVDFITNSLIFMFLIFHVILCIKTIIIKLCCAIFVSCRTSNVADSLCEIIPYST